MKKIIIIALLLSFSITGSVFAQQSENEGLMSQFGSIQEAVERLRETTREHIGENFGQRVRQMREEFLQEGEDFGEHVREMATQRMREMKEERETLMEAARNRFNEMANEASQENQRFRNIPGVLNILNERAIERHADRLQEIEDKLWEARKKMGDLTEDQEEEFDQMKEEALQLWEELPAQGAKSYFEELTIDDPSEVRTAAIESLRNFRNDHTEFLQTIKELRARIRNFEADSDEDSEA